jgi:hypothetical protein
MCHALYLASPLTLSEIRSMLPRGIAADLLPPADATLLRAQLSTATTAARLLIGPCSCDFLLPRDRAGESELRREWARIGLSRDEVIKALERHRRGAAEGTASPAHWQQALAAFVAEHARNAGPTLYYRHVTTRGLAGRPPAREVPVVLPLARVLADPAGWLEPERLTVVVRMAP